MQARHVLFSSFGGATFLAIAGFGCLQRPCCRTPGGSSTYRAYPAVRAIVVTRAQSFGLFGSAPQASDDFSSPVTMMLSCSVIWMVQVFAGPGMVFTRGPLGR
jgi:hypothetical protein